MVGIDHSRRLLDRESARRRVRRCFALILLVAIVTAGALVTGREWRISRAIAALNSQGFYVGRTFEEGSLTAGVIKHVFEPLDWDASRLGTVTRVTDEPMSESATLVDLTPILNFPQLRVFRWGNDEGPGRREKITDELLKPLHQVQSLTAVHIIGESSLTDEFIQGLANCPNLESLAVRSDGVTDAGLASLGELQNLQALYLDGCHISQGLNSLHVGRLQILHLQGTQVDDEGIRSLSHAGQLETLWLTDTSITDACFDVVEQLPAFRSLSVRGTRVTDGGLKEWDPVAKDVIVIATKSAISLEAALELGARRPDISIVVDDPSGRQRFLIVEEGRLRNLEE